MTRDDGDRASGASRATPAWNGQYYLYEVDGLRADAPGRSSTNLVTDPYSLSLSTELRAQPDRRPRRPGASSRAGWAR